MTTKKRIIYILGAGRSGTTLLEILLGNHPDVFSCGELNRYPKRMGVPPQAEPNSPKDIFWQKIRQKMGGDALIAKQEALYYKYEYHLGFIKSLLFPPKGTDFQSYTAFVSQLNHCIFDAIPNAVITDSSKYPGRAVHLSKDGTFDVSYIYLKRNPVDVVRSFATKDLEQPPKHWIAANLYYFVVNSLCKLAIFRLQKHHKTVEITYEDMLGQPDKTLTTIGQALGIDFSPVKEKLARREPLAIGMLFDGNRIRLQESLHINYKPKQYQFSLVDRFTRTFNYFLYS